MPKAKSGKVEKVPKLSARAFPTRQQMITLVHETGIGFWIEKALIYKAGIDVRDTFGNWRAIPMRCNWKLFSAYGRYLEESKQFARGGYPLEQVQQYHSAFR